MNGWVPVQTGDGSWTLRHPQHGQACHSLAGAWQEAVERYAIPCRLRELGGARSGGVVRLLDIGTGVALNLAAARVALAGTGAVLDAVTLEVDPDVLSSAAQLPATPPDPSVGLAELRSALATWREAPHAVLELPASSATAALRLRLRLGDARAEVAALAAEGAFDAVFLDPFSPGVEPDLWDPDFLGSVAALMTPPAVLSTYSAATRVRRALRSAGLEVGVGPRVGTKSAGTLASWTASLPPLGEREARRALPRTTPPHGG